MKASCLFTNIHKLSWRVLAIIISIFAALPALAEQVSAESADFTVNTIPEPAALLFILLAGFLLRRLRGTKTLLAVLLSLGIAMPAMQSYAAAPIVTNVTAQQQAWPLTDVDIYYDIYDNDDACLNVTVAISTNSGKAYDVKATSVSGDIGSGIKTKGIYKHIIWDVTEDLPFFSSSTVRVKITVDDDMVLIPAGSFEMGNCMDPHEGYNSELPVHTVNVSAFYMDKYEATKAKWDEVYNWAIANGYTFDNIGSGKADDHPVQEINWYDMVKWCNARSEKEGRTPCYYTNATKTTVYKTGQVDVENDWVKWEANGYRLPTEAEWEKAARGGAAGHRFPWTDADTITHSRANYWSSLNDSYDVSPTRGYHPDYNDGTKPYTSPVGSFAPNGYGLYDMAGNVCERCWDKYASNYYIYSPDNNPRGPAYGTWRVCRDGGWSIGAYIVRIASRGSRRPYLSCNYRGFRCVCQ